MVIENVAVAGTEKPENVILPDPEDAARFRLYRALGAVGYGEIGAIVRINSRDCQADTGVGIFTADGKKVAIPSKDVKRIIALSKACEVYHGDL